MKPIKVGDAVRVKEDMFTRGRQEGVVIDVFDDGVAIDFFCDVFGDPRGLPSIEYWAFSELEDCER